MDWNKHLRDVPSGSHALLSPSRHSFPNYDKEAMFKAYASYFAASLGTALHELAAKAINGRVKINKRDEHLIRLYLQNAKIPDNVYDPKIVLENLSNYVCDGIGYRMETEQPLIYSDFCFGTADTIQFYENKRQLRIHDLKTGMTPVSMAQLEIYAALFHLEYDRYLNITPQTTDTILCIYQGGEVIDEIPDPEVITDLMHSIIERDKWLREFKEGGVV